MNDLVERNKPFYKVVSIWRDRREKALKIKEFKGFRCKYGMTLVVEKSC